MKPVKFPERYTVLSNTVLDNVPEATKQAFTQVVLKKRQERLISEGQQKK